MKKFVFTFLIIGTMALSSYSQNRRTISFDVAVDANSQQGQGLPVAGPPQRGNTFIILGKIFPSGTLLPGPQDNDPNAEGSIGDFYCRATFANNIPTATGLPELFNTQLFRFSSQNQLTTEGVESSDGPWTRAITGGTGIYFGAAGSERIEVIGTNGSTTMGHPGFNERVTFTFETRRDG